MEVSKNRENTIIFLTKCLLVVLGLFTTIPYINDVGRDVYKRQVIHQTHRQKQKQQAYGA